MDGDRAITGTASPDSATVRRIVMIGSGNVATHLTHALSGAGYAISQIYSPNIAHAQALAATVDGCRACSDIAALDTDADCYIISVKDDAIPRIAAEVRQVIADSDALVVHTSGSVGMEALSSAGLPCCGVMYPLQTFSRDVPVDVSRIPFFTEGITTDVTARIDSLAATVSTRVYHADSARRERLHIAAVFGCNFVNYMLDVADGILTDAGYDLQVLEPLLRVTVDKALTHRPHQVQTGPAVRGDRTVIDKHLRALDPTLGQIYRLLSEQIYTGHHDPLA